MTESKCNILAALPDVLLEDILRYSDGKTLSCMLRTDRMIGSKSAEYKRSTGHPHVLIDQHIRNDIAANDTFPPGDFIALSVQRIYKLTFHTIRTGTLTNIASDTKAPGAGTRICMAIRFCAFAFRDLFLLHWVAKQEDDQGCLDLFRDSKTQIDISPVSKEYIRIIREFGGLAFLPQPIKNTISRHVATTPKFGDIWQIAKRCTPQYSLPQIFDMIPQISRVTPYIIGNVVHTNTDALDQDAFDIFAHPVDDAPEYLFNYNVMLDIALQCIDAISGDLKKPVIARHFENIYTANLAKRYILASGVSDYSPELLEEVLRKLFTTSGRRESRRQGYES